MGARDIYREKRLYENHTKQSSFDRSRGFICRPPPTHGNRVKVKVTSLKKNEGRKGKRERKGTMMDQEGRRPHFRTGIHARGKRLWTKFVF